jgi:hypothetical protein
MKKSSVFSLILGSALSFSSYADISRSEFIDQLDSANCSQVPPEIYINTSIRDFDFANALSLSWISTAVLEENQVSVEEFEDQWQIANLEIIDNHQFGLRILIADHQDTTLVTFHLDNDHPAWLNSSEFVLSEFKSSFALGEETHQIFSSMLLEEWDDLLERVQDRAENKELWVYGHGINAAFAQLSAVGFENEGLHVDQIYLTNAPQVGSLKWLANANKLLAERVHSIRYENKLPQDLSRSGEAYICSMINALENE